MYKINRNYSSFAGIYKIILLLMLYDKFYEITREYNHMYSIHNMESIAFIIFLSITRLHERIYTYLRIWKSSAEIIFLPNIYLLIYILLLQIFDFTTWKKENFWMICFKWYKEFQNLCHVPDFSFLFFIEQFMLY